jgi:hypothetical protein
MTQRAVAKSRWRVDTFGARPDTFDLSIFGLVASPGAPRPAAATA